MTQRQNVWRHLRSGAGEECEALAGNRNKTPMKRYLVVGNSARKQKLTESNREPQKKDVWAFDRARQFS